MSDKVVLSEPSDYLKDVGIADGYGSRVALLNACLRLAPLHNAVRMNRDSAEWDSRFGAISTELSFGIDPEPGLIESSSIILHSDGKIRLCLREVDAEKSDEIVFQSLEDALADTRFRSIMTDHKWSVNYGHGEFDLFDNSFLALQMLERELKLIKSTLAATLSIDIEDLQEFLNKE